MIVEVTSVPVVSTTLARVSNEFYTVSSQIDALSRGIDKMNVTDLS